MSLTPVYENLDLLFWSFITTLQLFVVTFVLTLPIAILIACGRAYGPPWLKNILIALVYLVRGVPGVLVVVIVFYAIPFVGLTLDGFTSVVLTLSTIQVIYVAELFRAALLSIDRGQFEAGASLGLSWWSTFRLVVVPQAAIVAAPAFVSAAIQLMQNTTIASAVGLYDLLGRAQNLAVNYLNGTPILVVAPVYVIVLLPLVRFGRRLEARLAVGRR